MDVLTGEVKRRIPFSNEDYSTSQKPPTYQENQNGLLKQNQPFKWQLPQRLESKKDDDILSIISQEMQKFDKKPKEKNEEDILNTSNNTLISERKISLNVEITERTYARGRTMNTEIVTERESVSCAKTKEVFYLLNGKCQMSDNQIIKEFKETFTSSIQPNYFQVLSCVYRIMMEENNLHDEGTWDEKNFYSSIKYPQQLRTYLSYHYFQKYEQEIESEIPKFQIESDKLEASFKEKVKSSPKLNSIEFTMLALKKHFNLQGKRVFFTQETDFHEISDSVAQKQQQQIDIIYKNYNNEQGFISKTNFSYGNYHRITLDSLDHWTFESAMANRRKFALYFKKKLGLQNSNLTSKDYSRLTILQITKGSMIIDFAYPEDELGELVFEKTNIKVHSIMGILQINCGIFDPEWNMTWSKTNNRFFRGQINGQKQEYFLPVGYHGVGLKVLGEGLRCYPDDGWLDANDSEKTWMVLFHKTTGQFAPLILDNGFKQGNRQQYRASKCRFGRGLVGEGIYFSNKIEECQQYGNIFDVEGNNIELIFQVRVNTKTVKSPIDKPQYFIVSDPKDIRPYRICLRSVQKK